MLIMKISAIKFAAAILIVNFPVSLQEQIYWIGRTGQYLPYGQPQYSASQGFASQGLLTQQIQQPYSSQVIRNQGLSNDATTPQIQQSYVSECDEHEEEKAAQSFKKLMLLGDKDLLVSETDDHQAEHCADAQRQLQSFLNHIKCTEGRFSDEMTLLGKGFTNWVNNRCYSKAWHDNYIAASQCYAKPQVQEEWHNCHDKNIASLGWILQNVPAKHQVDAMCCYIPLTKQCQHNKTDVYCGRQVADASAELIWQPWNERVDTWCLGKLDCHEYPKVKKAMNKIWNSPTSVMNSGKFYKFIYNVLQNTFNQC